MSNLLLCIRSEGVRYEEFCKCGHNRDRHEWKPGEHNPCTYIDCSCKNYELSGKFLKVIEPLIPIRYAFGWDDKSLQSFLDETIVDRCYEPSLRIKHGKFKGQRDIIGSVNVKVKGGGGWGLT